MEKRLEIPVMKVIRFHNSDVIATSSPFSRQYAVNEGYGDIIDFDELNGSTN